jgi:cytochrome c oxidase subunit 4
MAHAAHASHDHADHLADENNKFYTFVNLALFMAVVTGLELVAVYLPFHLAIVWTIIVFLSVIKFAGVCTWFMHLIYDKALLTILFLSGIIIAIPTSIALLCLFVNSDVDGKKIKHGVVAHVPVAEEQKSHP